MEFYSTPIGTLFRYKPLGGVQETFITLSLPFEDSELNGMMVMKVKNITTGETKKFGSIRFKYVKPLTLEK